MVRQANNKDKFNAINSLWNIRAVFRRKYQLVPFDIRVFLTGEEDPLCNKHCKNQFDGIGYRKGVCYTKFPDKP